MNLDLAGAIIHVISNTCAFPIRTGSNVFSENDLLYFHHQISNQLKLMLKQQFLRDMTSDDLSSYVLRLTMP